MLIEIRPEQLESLIFGAPNLAVFAYEKDSNSRKCMLFFRVSLPRCPHTNN